MIVISGATVSMPWIVIDAAYRTFPDASVEEKQTLCPFARLLLNFKPLPSLYALVSPLIVSALHTCSALITLYFHAVSPSSLSVARTIFAFSGVLLNGCTVIDGAVKSMFITSEVAYEALPAMSVAAKQAFVSLLSSLVKEMSVLSM